LSVNSRERADGGKPQYQTEPIQKEKGARVSKEEIGISYTSNRREGGSGRKEEGSSAEGTRRANRPPSLTTFPWSLVTANRGGKLEELRTAPD